MPKNSENARETGNIATLIRLRRGDLGLSQDALAALLRFHGAPPSTAKGHVCNWERGRWRPSAALVPVIAASLEVGEDAVAVAMSRP